LDRGDVVGLPGQWRPTRTFEARIRPVRGLDHPLTARGAYKLYAGSAERDARIRFYGTTQLTESGSAFARIRLSAPLVLDVFDRFVLREAGRRETVAGGVVLDIEPPARPGPAPEERLSARESATRDELPRLLVDERGAVRIRDAWVLTGEPHRDVPRVGDWLVSEALRERMADAVLGALRSFHEEHPLLEGAELAMARATAMEALGHAGATADQELVDPLLEDLAARGQIAREGSTVRLASHRVTLAGREDEVAGLVRAVADGEPSPPTVADLVASGFSKEVIEAATKAGELVRVSPDLVMTPGFVRGAEAIVREAGATGITVSAFRERLGTSRKYALPLLEHFDHQGVTRRQGDVRVRREPG
ncbi:MAG: SelB C-terminal domain-containing protein, partial [Actinobacteria bacterium]|nr:SelB C-terminal domain-containing protein [Actinomycetota bacterium]